nr:uncharacterized protein LOC108074990 [Drosophila kikkawai]
MVNIGHIFVWALLLAITSGTDLSGDDNLNNVLSEFDSSSRLIRDTSLSAKNIEKIDVKCDQGNGMLVEIEFSEDFEGVIYSQGYFNDPQCNYVKGEKTGRSFVFSVPYNACGSKPACSVCASVENILIIQNDRDIQNNFDIARKISCSRGDEREKTVYFKPFVVDMLEVISVDTPSGPVKCWMEIGTGAPPNIKPISGSLSLGDDITFTINVEHSEQPWDVNILQCYASDDMDFEGRTTKRLQLSDNRGCSIKKKIFGEWRRYKGPSSLTSTYYNTLKAFRFPDRSQVYLKCDIELCNGACQRDNSYPSCGDSRTISCPEDSTDPLCLQNHLKNTTPKPRCFPGATDSRCPRVTTQPPVSARTVPTLRPTYTPLIPRKPETTSKTNCIQGSTDIDCLNCFPGSPDPRCPKIPTTKRAGCSEGSDDIKCQPATYLPPSTRRGSTDIDCLNCFPGSPDPRCPKIPTTKRAGCSEGSDDIKCQPATYLPPSTRRVSIPTKRLNCFPGSPDPRCPKIPTTKRAGCSEGSDDIKCQPATYLPPSTRRVSIPTKPATPITYAPPTPRTQITTARPDCFPGATDSRCPRVTTQSPVSARTTISSFRPSFTPPTPRISITTSKAQSSTYLPPVSARTVPTLRPTYTPLIPRKPETTSKTNCIQGSTDIDCLNCFPGSPDPRCPKIPTTKRAGCSEGSDDIKCQPATYLPPSTRRVSIPTKPATPITYAPPTPRTQITTARPDCFPGATDSRCPRVTTQSPVSARTTISSFRPSFTPPTPRISITTSKAQSSTYLPPVSARTVPTLRPTYTPLIPRKPETTSKTNCIQGSTDIDCLNCFPGSPDPRCPKIPTTKRAGCSEGSDDIKCQPATYLPPSTRRVSIPTKPTTPITYAPPTSRTQITTARPDCFPGATDSRCPRVTTQSPVSARTTIPSFRPTFTPYTQRTSITTTRTLIDATTPIYCYPGSIDPRCPDSGYRGTSRIPATYLPPLSDTGYDRTIRNAKTSFFKEINHLAFSDNNVFELDDDENEPSRVKRELRSDDQELDHNEDLLSRKIVKRETNERPSEQEVISLTLGVRMGISVK